MLLSLEAKTRATVQGTQPAGPMDLALSPPSNLVGIASDLANLADLAVANLLRDL
jgi:hypothetical protein